METQATANTTKKDIKYYLLSAIGVLIMFGFGYLPQFGSVTPLGMKLLGIFLGVIFLWCMVDMFWPSVLGILALVFCGYYGMTEAMLNSLGNPIVWNVIMVLFLIAAITKSGAAEFLARWFISRKYLNGNPLLFTFFYMLSFYIVSIVSNGAAIMLLSWSITRSVAALLNLDRRHKYIKYLYLFSSFSCCLGESVIPFKGYIYALTVSFVKISGSPLNYNYYILFALAFGVVMIALSAVSIIYLFKPDISALKKVDFSALSDKSVQRLTFRQASYFIALVLVIITIVASTALPKGSPFVEFISGMSTQGLFALAIIVLVAIRIKGEPILPFAKYSPGAIRWEAVFVVAAINPIAGAIAGKDTGIVPTISSWIAPIFSESSVFLILLIIVIGAVILTNALNNTAVGLLLIPLVVPILAQLGVSEAVYSIICVALIYSVTIGVMLPSASTLTVLLYTNEDLKPKDIFSHGGFFVLMYLVLSIASFVIWIHFAG